MVTTITLAREFNNVTLEDIHALVGQLVDIDGEEAVIAKQVPIYNGSNRLVGHEAYITDDAAWFIREHIRISEAWDE